MIAQARARRRDRRAGGFELRRLAAGRSGADPVRAGEDRAARSGFVHADNAQPDDRGGRSCGSQARAMHGRRVARLLRLLEIARAIAHKYLGRHEKGAGAGTGNRTRVFSLEGCCSTIELHPRRAPKSRCRRGESSRDRQVFSRARPAEDADAPAAGAVASPTRGFLPLTGRSPVTISPAAPVARHETETGRRVRDRVRGTTRRGNVPSGKGGGL